MINSFVRQLVVLLPCAFLFGKVTGSVDGVWWAFIVAEFFSFTLTMIFFARINKNVIKKL